MNRYLLTLGRTPKLAFAELTEVLQNTTYSIIWSSEKHVYLESEISLDGNNLVHILGGVVKLAKEKASFTDEENLISELTNILISKKLSKVTFAVTTWISEIDANDIAKNVKKELRENNLSSRFVLSKTEDGVSSVLIKKQDVIEYQIINIKNNQVIFETEAVQEFEEWNRRDYGRPEINPKAGMLPPKVARMMINLAYSVLRSPKTNLPAEALAKAGDQQPILMDPFCGVGTIPMESLMMGVKFIASDQSKEMIEKTKKNILWLKNEYQLSLDGEYFVNDATHVSEILSPEYVDAIVTEPFLGPNFEKTPTKEYILQIVNGLEKLYIGCLKDWHKIMKIGGRVIMIIPKFRIGTFEISCKKAIDNCENLGYTLLSGPWEYAREQAIVVREIYVLQKNNKE